MGAVTAAPAIPPGIRNGLPEWRPYTYRGTGRDELTAWMDATPEPRTLQPCGTEAAYARHLKNGEPTDTACRRAHRAHKNRYRTGAR